MNNSIMKSLTALAVTNSAILQKLLDVTFKPKATVKAKATPTAKPKATAKAMPTVAKKAAPIKAEPKRMSPIRQLRDYTANALTFSAEGPMSAKESDPVWLIQKIFLTDDYRIKETQELKGAWVNRDKLPWKEPVRGN